MTLSPVPPEIRLLVEAALPHVAFDGWSDAALQAALDEIGMDAAAARALLPRGAVDLAVASHRMGDAEMLRRLAESDLGALRYRDRVAAALRLRLEVIEDREAVRRATTMFALPHLAPTGAGLIWGTADAIWTALGDTSTDGNWYTKRATLSAVWAAVVLYWLGDESPGAEATAAFIDRRIGDVMAFEGAKARVRAAPLLRPLTGPLSRLMAGIRAPGAAARDDLPGRWTLDEGARDV